jgi:CubicO group peptidase (beta-lactamase class C family)
MTPPPDSIFREICDAIEHHARRLSIPGVAVGVWRAGREYQHGYGVTSVEHPLPIAADTLFQVGSITKTFLATAVMRLVEQGRLGLDTPLRAYLPDLRLADDSTAARVTMRHLLTHTGGWVGDYFNDFGYGDDALAKMTAQLAHLPQLTPLGEVYSYNNSGFYLAGRVVEVVAGQTFETAMRELLFEPLGLQHSFFFTPETPPDPEPIPPVRLAFYAEDHVIALDEPYKDAYGEFLRDAAGQVAWLRFGGRVRARET